MRCSNPLVEYLKNSLRVLSLALIIVLTSFLAVIEEYFVDNELTQDLAIKCVLLEFEFEVLDVSVARLIFLLVKLLEERMLKSFISTESLCWIIRKELLQ